MSKQEMSEGTKQEALSPQQHSLQQGFPPAQGNPLQYAPQQGYRPQQGHAPQGVPPQQGYYQAQYQAGGHVIVTQPQSTIIAEPKPPDYLVFSIVVCICCCCPIGIVSLICSVMSLSAYRNGDLATARAEGLTALVLNIIGVVVVIICIITLLVLNFRQ